MPRYEEPSDKQWRWAMAKVNGIDFSDTLFVLKCGCIVEGCSGAANLDRFERGQGKMYMVCLKDHPNQWTELVEIVTTGEI